jgi:hypothetical protein
MTAGRMSVREHIRAAAAGNPFFYVPLTKGPFVS